MTKFMTTVLLQIKHWTVWYMDHHHHIHELQTFKNGPVFMAHPVYRQTLTFHSTGNHLQPQ